MYYFDNKSDNSVNAVGVEKDDSKELIYLHKGKNETRQQYNFNYKDYEKEIAKNGIRGRQKQYILSRLEKAYFEGLNESDLLLESDGFRELFKYVKNEEEKKSKFIAKSKIIPMIRNDWFNVVYANGPSGAGKTKVVVKIVQSYLKQNKKAEVYLISKKEKDKTIDQIKNVKRLDVTTFIDDPIKVEEFPDKCVIIFDDFEGYETDKKLYKQIIGFLNDCMTMGRTKLIQIFIITHSSALGKASTLIFQEASYFILYPQSMSHQSLKYIMQEKIGFDTTQIRYIKNLKSKYVCIHKAFPRYIISGNEIEII